ncbi:hypothetical protein SKAU_G00230380 [Synaphobranchus kaupii]|uniref:Uncharacterized protein n=1 Tax=Synaphobranchus kaupii TaxID=118154 RepID=A0A9Q1F5G6_SYNKA|nr:hypothetical protein SKAU_G00230380 [Synaphobranchus kaupii]
MLWPLPASRCSSCMRFKNDGNVPGAGADVALITDLPPDAGVLGDGSGTANQRRLYQTPLWDEIEDLCSHELVRDKASSIATDSSARHHGHVELSHVAEESMPALL